jgi:protein involved in polysaccharide export with SLBB domain
MFPGTYALVKPYETLLEVLNRSGGLNNYANKDFINIIRKKQLVASSKLKKISKEIQKKQRIDDPLSTQTFNDDLKDLEDTSSNNQRDEMNVVPMDTISVNLKLLYDAKAGNKYDINLLSGDILNAIPVNNTVRVSGQVNKEVIINYFGDNLKGYIDEAGGFSSTADKKSVYVLEVDQSSKSTKSFLWFRNYPRVSPGSMVIVPSKPLELNKANDNGRLMSMSSLLASTSGIILALLTFLKK